MTVQNKMHWAVHRHTAAELIVERANAEKEHMGYDLRVQTIPANAKQREKHVAIYARVSSNSLE